MPPSVPKISIDQLIEIVVAGGRIRTGIDIFNRQGTLLLEKDVLVSEAKTLEKIKRLGVVDLPIVASNAGGLWDKDGKQIRLPAPESIPSPAKRPTTAITSEVDRRIEEICELKEIACQKYEHAKQCIKEVLSSIQQNGGKFDFEMISDTVTGLFEFVSKHENAFSYLTREIFSYDNYLYNHSINVCTIGTVIMRKFNDNFNAAVNSFLNSGISSNINDAKMDENSFSYFQPDEMIDISIGFFMHDMGKILVAKEIMNKPGKLTTEEFEVVKSHSTEKGLQLLETNNLINPYLANISLYHHSRLYRDEPNCYPLTKSQNEIQPYVKVCKLADIYDAMTSKRCYKEALNPVAVVTEIFHKYAEKDPLLQYILHSFVKSVGIYPPGSIVALTNGQLAYVLDSQGPILLPVTDSQGATLATKPDMLVLDKGETSDGLKVDRRKPAISPLEAYKILPDYLIKTIQTHTA